MYQHVLLRQWFLMGSDLAQGTMLRDVPGCPSLEGGALLASRKLRSGMLLHIPTMYEAALHSKGLSRPSVKSAKAEKLCFKSFALGSALGPEGSAVPHTPEVSVSPESPCLTLLKEQRMSPCSALDITPASSLVVTCNARVCLTRPWLPRQYLCISFTTVSLPPGTSVCFLCYFYQGQKL